MQASYRPTMAGDRTCIDYLAGQRFMLLLFMQEFVASAYEIVKVRDVVEGRG